MLAHPVEVRGAGTKDCLVCRKPPLISHQRDVSEPSLLPHLVHGKEGLGGVARLYNLAHLPRLSSHF